jgi:hypothetical protein
MGSASGEDDWSPRIYQDAAFFNGRFWLCHKKIVRAQKRTNDPFKNETREREKEWGEQNFSEKAIARQHTDEINDGQECIDKTLASRGLEEPAHASRGLFLINTLLLYPSLSPYSRTD